MTEKQIERQKRDKLILAAYEKSGSIKELQKQLNVSYNTVQRVLHNHNIKNPTKIKQQKRLSSISNHWHTDKNYPKKIEDIQNYSIERYWWLCPNCKTEKYDTAYNYCLLKKCRGCIDKEKTDDVLALLQETQDIKKIASLAKITINKVKNVLYSHDIPIPQRTKTPSINIKKLIYEENKKNKSKNKNNQKLTIEKLKKETIMQIINEYVTTQKSQEEIKQEFNLSHNTKRQLLINTEKLFTKNNKYKVIKNNKHHRSDSTGKVFFHILVAEKKLGRPVLRNEQVHHVDFNKNNNNPDNLAVGTPQSHGFWHKTHYSAMALLIPTLIENNILCFTEENGYQVNIKALEKIEKLLKKEKPQLTCVK